MKFRVDFYSTNAEVEAKDEEEAARKAFTLLYDGELYVEIESMEEMEEDG